MVAENCLSIQTVAVGGKHFYVAEENELTKAQTLLTDQLSTFLLTSGAYCVRSLYIPQHGYSGTLYRNDEHVLVNSSEDCEAVVIQISKIFVLQSITFVTGSKYFATGTHLPSGNATVKRANMLETNLGQSIIRKVMLYPDNEQPDCFIVIDFQRPQLPFLPRDIVVPQFPVPGDMVSVDGGDEETWLAHVQSTIPSSKTCQVYFYMPDEDNSTLYKRERHRIERVHWDSILCLVPGQWLNDTQYIVCST